MDITWLLTAVVGLLILYLVYYQYTKKTYWEQRGVTQVKSSIFKFFKQLTLSNISFLDYTIDMYKKYHTERFVGYTFANNRVLIVTDPELIQHVLIKDFSYFEDRSLPLDGKLEMINLGLASLTGPKWRLLRHKLTPTFTSGKMKMMFTQIKECSDEFVLYLKDKKGKDLETRDFLFKYMVDVIANTAFSMKANAFDDNNQNEFLQISKQFFKPSWTLQIKVILLTMLPKFKDIFKIRMIDSKVNDFFLRLTKSLIEQRKESGKKRNDFLQLMLDQKEKEMAILSNVNSKKLNGSTDNDAAEHEDREMLEYLKSIKYDKDSVVFSDDCIAAQTFTFISGGSETTSATLSFTLHELAVNQDVQRKLQAEIDSVLSGQELNYESLKKMKYLEQIINEVLRFRSPGAVLQRMCVQDYKIPGSDIILEKGCMVQVPVVGIHRDAQYFPDPEKFNPDRFEDMNSITKGTFLPFGDGPRMCIAMRLAMLEMKVFLAVTLASYNVVHSEKTPLPLVMDKKSFLQHVKNGLWVKFEARQ